MGGIDPVFAHHDPELVRQCRIPACARDTGKSGENVLVHLLIDIAVEPVPGGPHQLYRPLDPLVADREQAAQIDKCGDTLRAEILRRQRFREDRVPFRRHHRSFSARAPFEWPGQKTAGKDHAARQLGLAIAKQQVMERPRLDIVRSEEHTSELQSLMRISYAVFCLKKKKINTSKSTVSSHYDCSKMTSVNIRQIDILT